MTTSANGPAAAVTPRQPPGRGELGRRGLGRVDGRGHVGAALGRERVVERGAGVHHQAEGQTEAAVETSSDEADHDGLHPAPGQPAAHRPATGPGLIAAPQPRGRR